MSTAARDLPPLRAVQAFEAVGRCGSIKGAAAELGVSSGAVTQQIHLLEEYLGIRVVERGGRGVQLTIWGTLYLPYVQSSFEHLRTGKREVGRAVHSNRLTISALPSVANRWLSPLLFEWKKHHHDVHLQLEGVDPEPRLDEGEADFRISYGGRQRFHQRTVHLFTDHVIPVASPRLLPASGLSRPQQLLKFPLLWIDWGPEFNAVPTWSDWLAAAGLTCELERELTFSLSSTAIDAAIQGRGLVLAQYSMVQGELASGSLVRIFQRSLPLPEPYFLAWNRSATDKPLAVAFQSWLVTEGHRIDLALAV
jgi:LysR family transcriptional regulator, glycine cleavage system transcriptional activator